jgi:hypothetical protein
MKLVSFDGIGRSKAEGSRAGKQRGVVAIIYAFDDVDLSLLKFDCCGVAGDCEITD